MKTKAFSVAVIAGTLASLSLTPVGAQPREPGGALTQGACVSDALIAAIAPERIGEPVSAVALDAPAWVPASGNTPAHCMVTGRLEPVSTEATARDIRFGVALPAQWNGRSIQMGGGGMNGTVPALAGGFGGPSHLANGFATYGSDSGHSAGDEEWALNDEAIQNLGFMQMKKTHDVAMVLLERAYGTLPAYHYYVGNSQGGREGLMVAQRYPADYDGVLSTVPIVGFSSLMLAPTLTRIEEKPLERWVPPAKGNAILAEFMRQCDDLDGRVDGIIHNYYDCRARFNVNDGVGSDDPWAARRCPDNVDPDPADASQNACLTDGQIETLHFVFSEHEVDAALPHGRTTFGMWAPTTAVGNAGALTGRAAQARGEGAGGPGGFFGGGFPGGGLFTAERYSGQEGAGDDARAYTALGSIGVNGFVMQDITANPLDYDVDRYRARREQIAAWLDTTHPDLGAFRERGGKLIVAVGTDDTIASSGEQLDYFQSLLDTMGREAVDSFARLFVAPQAGHGLSGRSAPIDGLGNAVETRPIPSQLDRLALLQNWVENGVAPGMSEVMGGQGASLPLCSYPQYPHFNGGDAARAESYTCTMPASAAGD